MPLKMTSITENYTLLLLIRAINATRLMVEFLGRIYPGTTYHTLVMVTDMNSPVEVAEGLSF
jgi:hypothetical protein